MEKTQKRLTVALAVYNEAECLERCLTSVREIADELIIVDGGSTDSTCDIAKKFGSVIIKTDNPPIFHINKQKAIARATCQWVLQLDADEVVSDALKLELVEIMTRKDAKDGYFLPRKNYFLGKWLRKGGQYPDYLIRFFRNGKGKFPQKSVHEQIVIDGTVGYLINPLDHYSYTSIGQYWRKSAIYIQLTASEIKKNHLINRPFAPLIYYFVRPVYTFYSLYIRHKGFMDGWHGFLFALFSALHFPKAFQAAQTDL